jgi:tryptophan-rich sensory protein
MWKKIKPYVILIAISLAVGILSALFTKDSMDIYSTLNQPPFSPPSWLFPVVWTVLFTLMGISAAMVYTKDRTNKGLLINFIQLAVNFLWSIIFFNFRAFLFSFIWLILLWILILAMILEYRKTDKVAAYLQIPYLIWVTFAGYLNYMIYILN